MTSLNYLERRSSRGSGIVEGVCATFMIASVTSLLVAGCMDIYFMMVNMQKIQVAADAAARVCNAGMFWQGTYRPDWNSNATQARALATANFLLSKMGLGSCTIDTFEPNLAVTDANGNDVGARVSHVRLTVSAIKLPFTSLGIPSIMDLHADGFSSDSSFTPYALAVISFTPLGQADAFGRPLPGVVSRRIQVPMVGMDYQDSSGNVTQPSVGQNGSAIPGGKYVGIEARSYGEVQPPNYIDLTGGTMVVEPQPW